jgi:hypothetical protein
MEGLDLINPNVSASSVIPIRSWVLRKTLSSYETTVQLTEHSKTPMSRHYVAPANLPNPSYFLPHASRFTNFAPFYFSVFAPSVCFVEDILVFIRLIWLLC